MSSRESDSAFPPRRKSQDAYPSGTPPYGTSIPGDPFAPAGQPAAGREAPDEDVPRTETTLTTRVSINIPGSRPIPPVVVRSAVKTEEPSAEAPAPAEPGGRRRHRGETASSPVLGVVDADAPSTTPPNLPPEWQDDRPASNRGAAPSEPDSNGEWFKPRQKSRTPERQETTKPPVPAAAGGPAPGPNPALPPPPPGGPVGHPDQPSAPRQNGAPASPFAAAEQPGRGDTPFRRPNPANRGQGGAPTAQPGRDPFAPEGRRETPAAAGDRRAPQQSDPFAPPQAPGRPTRDEEPDDARIGGFNPIRDDGATGGIPGAAKPHRPGAGSSPVTGNRSGGPGTDPFAAPAPGGGAFAATKSADPFAGPADPFAAPADPFAAKADPFATTRPGIDSPSGPGQKPNGRFADVPFDPASTFPGSAKAANGQESAPAAANTEGAKKAAAGATPVKKAPSKSKKASKLVVYGVGGLLFLGAAAYGTGLMLNQSDIPKGTTVLGTGIGGDSRDQAVTALDATVGKTGQQPIKLKIGGQDLQLDPVKAGLSFDTTATADSLTKHSYNPMDVIGSLAGSSKAVSPVIHVDQAKLKSALQGLTSASGQGLQEGFIQFTEDGKAQVVPGKAGQALDINSAMDLVQQAYRNRADGQPDGVISLNLTAAQPKIGADVLQAAADGIGKQVMNGNITVTAGGKTFTFGAKTAAKALTLVAADDSGKTFVPKWDDAELEKAVANTFAGVKIRKAGAVVPITTKDIEDAIASVFDKSAKDRKAALPS